MEPVGSEIGHKGKKEKRIIIISRNYGITENSFRRASLRAERIPKASDFTRMLEISDEDMNFANSHAKYFKNTTLRVFNMKKRTIEIYKPIIGKTKEYTMKELKY